MQNAVELISRDWDARAKALEVVRKRLRNGWRNDDEVLEQYFASCVDNWKKYTGPRKPRVVLKLQAIYKQAVIGDCNDSPPGNLKTVEGAKWSTWYGYKGMDKNTAKRRFITILTEIDPLLIDVMPDEKPPLGFPLDRSGRQICAKCNTKVGCTRPLMDQSHRNLKQQLLGDEELYNPDKLKEWIRNAMKNQQCIWGMHVAISKIESHPFATWFARKENQGFLAYDSSSIMLMVKELLIYNCEVAYAIVLNPGEFIQEQIDLQALRLVHLKKVYEEFTGDLFEYEVECTRYDDDMCNQRRFADGGVNHTHPMEIELPKRYESDTYQEAIKLRMECQKLRLSVTTGNYER